MKSKFLKNLELLDLPHEIKAYQRKGISESATQFSVKRQTQNAPSQS